jgi:predicted metal-dependent peptidase
MTARDKKIERAQLRTLFRVPFFAPGLARLPIEWSDAVPTAATNGKRILCNPGFFDTLPDEVWPTILCHETAHCLLGHLWRMPKGGDPEVWNQAIDHATNLMLKGFSQVVMAKGLADPFPFPKPEESYCADPRFAGMSEEQIYAILMREAKPRGKGKQPGKGGQPGQPDPHSMPVFGEVEPADPADPKQRPVKVDWDHAAIQAAKQAQSQGMCPDSLSRLVDSLVSSQVPWYSLLRSWLREQANDDWDFMTPALEYSESGFMLPSLHSDKIGAAVFATDTSGSMDHDANVVVQSEKQGFLDDCRPSKLVDIYCDTVIHKVAEYSPGDRIELDAPGGGGTDFCPVFEHVAKLPVQPKCLVYLTDLCGSFPDPAPDYPTLWIVTGDEKPVAPFGMTVYVKG